jgi:hypothetical protein
LTTAAWAVLRAALASAAVFSSALMSSLPDMSASRRKERRARCFSASRSRVRVFSASASRSSGRKLVLRYLAQLFGVSWMG